MSMFIYSTLVSSSKRAYPTESYQSIDMLLSCFSKIAHEIND